MSIKNVIKQPSLVKAGRSVPFWAGWYRCRSQTARNAVTINFPFPNFYPKKFHLFFQAK